jgi:hypothetical protein
MARRVSLFVTCIVDQLFPSVGIAMAGSGAHWLSGGFSRSADLLRTAGFQQRVSE